jgi:hypothetical protein
MAKRVRTSGAFLNSQTSFRCRLVAASYVACIIGMSHFIVKFYFVLPNGLQINITFYKFFEKI